MFWRIRLLTIVSPASFLQLTNHSFPFYANLVKDAKEVKQSPRSRAVFCSMLLQVEEAVQAAAGRHRLRDSGQAFVRSPSSVHGPGMLRSAFGARLPADLRRAPEGADREREAQLPRTAPGARRPLLPLQKHTSYRHNYSR